MPTAFADAQIDDDPHRLDGEPSRTHNGERARVVAVAVDPVVHGPRRRLEPEPANERHREPKP